MPLNIESFWLWDLQDAIAEPFWWYGWLLLILLFLLIWIFNKTKKDLVEIFSDEDGGVLVTPHALQELVSKSCFGMDGIDSPTTKILRNGSKIRLVVRIRVNTDCNVKETRKVLKEKLENIMFEKLCFSNFEGVDLIIKGFSET